MVQKITKKVMIKFLWKYATDEIIKKLSNKYSFDDLYKLYILEKKRIRLGYYE